MNSISFEFLVVFNAVFLILLVLPSVCYYRPQGFLKRIIFEFFVRWFTDFQVSLGSVIRAILISLLMSCLPDSLLSIILGIRMLNKPSSHPNFTCFIWKRSSYISQLSLGFWMGQLRAFLVRQGLPLGFLFGQGHFLSSEVA